MNDNDRELLELAAKAAGHRGFCYEDGFCWIEERTQAGIYPVKWNPLEDDGDAFRLMVACQISVTPCCGSTYIDAGGQLDFSHIHGENETANSGARRAIVMMAAEIGRGM